MVSWVWGSVSVVGAVVSVEVDSVVGVSVSGSVSGGGRMRRRLCTASYRNAASIW